MYQEKCGILVTVIIPCYNYGIYLTDAIRSVMSQTLKEVKIIVVNDGSDDQHTLNVLKTYENVPLVQIIHQKNAKTSSARNIGITQAASKYVCCLDADDCFTSDYLKKCIFHLEMGGYSICGSWQQNFGCDDSVVIPEPFTMEGILSSNRMIYSAVYRRSLWEQIGGYDEYMVDGYEDWEFWIRAANIGAKAFVIPEPMFLYRKHGKSRMDNALENHEAILDYIRKKHAKLYKRLKKDSGETKSSWLSRLRSFNDLN